eukprot:scaffold1307_cov200-Pinguiococcus_pyrenoidosus.AAC.115
MIRRTRDSLFGPGSTAAANATREQSSACAMALRTACCRRWARPAIANRALHTGPEKVCGCRSSTSRPSTSKRPGNKSLSFAKRASNEDGTTPSLWR